MFDYNSLLNFRRFDESSAKRASLELEARSLHGLKETLLWPYRNSSGPHALWIHRRTEHSPSKRISRLGGLFMLAANDDTISVVRLQEGWPGFLPGETCTINIPVKHTIAVIEAARHWTAHSIIDLSELIIEGGQETPPTRQSDFGEIWTNVDSGVTGAYLMWVPTMLDVISELQVETGCTDDDPIELSLVEDERNFRIEFRLKGRTEELALDDVVDWHEMDFLEDRPYECSKAPESRIRSVLDTKQFRSVLEACPEYDIADEWPFGTVRLVWSGGYLYVTDAPHYPYTTSHLHSIDSMHVIHPVDT